MDTQRDAMYECVLDTSITKYEFDHRWSVVRDRSIPLVELIGILQPLVNTMHVKDTPKGFNVRVEYVIYMSKWISLGFDGSYFTSGSGAPNNCAVS